MIKIRKSIFETNSSSSHSLSLGQLNDGDEKMDCEFNESITLGNGDYNWEWEDYGSWIDKADYVTILLLGSRLGDRWGEEKIASNDIKKDSEADMIVSVIHRKYPNAEITFDLTGGIDHESDYVQDWMKNEDDLFTFFFGDGGVSTGNDNDDNPPFQKY